jgi:translation initiation factor IF-3
MAEEAELDLIEVNPASQPPICKIMDYGQYVYQQSRKLQEAKQKSKRVETKNIQLTFKIGKGDIETKQKQSAKFIAKGNIVRIELRLRGREKQHAGLALKIVTDFIATLSVPVKIDQPTSLKNGLISAQISKKAI